MLTVFRSNRAEWLAEVLAAQLHSHPPAPFELVEVVVNTWPTSRWLGEQLAVELGGVAAHIRFPFPGTLLRRVVDGVLGEGGLGEGGNGRDPWRAAELVWPVLELLPELEREPAGEPLRLWLRQRGGPGGQHLELARWQLGRAIADAIDDYALYRPELLTAWWQGVATEPAGAAAPAWQPLLVQLLARRLGVKPFGLRVLEAIQRLDNGPPPPGSLPAVLRLFGLSSLAPVQVRLLRALSVHIPVDLFLLTPGAELWRRCGDRRRALSDAIALQQPIEGDWLIECPGLEARFGRLGGEFQQLLEGSGGVAQGQWQERDLFGDPTAAHPGPGPAPLLHQLQRQLAQAGWDGPGTAGPDPPLLRARGDSSLEFHPCPGRLRQVEIVRDRVLQLLADDSSLEPRDVLVMTPQVDRFAPLLASVFGDREATGVSLAWRLTDRSQQSEAGIGRSLVALLRLAGERLTASGLEDLLESRPLQEHVQLRPEDVAELHRLLQRAGFHWGLDGQERGGRREGSLAWAIDRLLLGLVLPEAPGLAPAATAPLASGHDLELVGRWLLLLGRLRHWLTELRQPRPMAAWAGTLRELLADLFGDGGEAAWELPVLLAAIDDAEQAAADCGLELEAAVLTAVLEERLSADAGRFGHRSGALTISALEPMRAIPHRVIVLMGLDEGVFPRQRFRPGFHLLERQRRLGDPNPADQDRYVLLEALLSARDHLLITWSSRDERKGESLPPSPPVRQWLDWLAQQLGDTSGLVVEHPANPLERGNFLPGPERPAASCDRRLLLARRLLEGDAALQRPLPLAASEPPEPLDPAALEPGADPGIDLRDWLMAPQRQWLRELGLRPGEWADTIDDLGALCLEERQRAALLRQTLADPELGADGGPARAGHWLVREQGRGLLPPLAAGELEAELLAQRWRDLQAALDPLGAERQQELSWDGWSQRLHWRGEHLLLIHTARDRCRHRLDLWLQLLLACAAGTKPGQGLLVARGQSSFEVRLQLQPLDSDDARRELKRLAALREQWRRRCWPVPPETGWALLHQGPAQAAEVWEGGVGRPGERRQAEQSLCFGAALPAAELLQPPFTERAIELLGPLLERLA